jgi:hypothetical protein
MKQRVRGRKPAAMLAVVVGLALALAAPAPAQAFTMTSPLALALGAIADTATVEQARCLFGHTRPNTVVADSAVEPDVTRRGGLIVSIKPCPFGAVALWHVHLLAQTRAPSAEAACFLSPGDVDAGMRRDAPLAMVVQVTRDVWCWWSRDDVLDAKLLRLVASPPPTAQLHRRSPPVDSLPR